MEQEIVVIGRFAINLYMHDGELRDGAAVGAAINSCLDLMALEVPAVLCAAIPAGPTGTYCREFAERNHIKLVSCPSSAPAPLMFVFQNEANPSYEFYRTCGDDALDSVIRDRKERIFLISGSYTTQEPFKKNIRALPASAVLYFDPNIRGAPGPLLLECANRADVFRISSDDGAAIVKYLGLESLEQFVAGTTCPVVLVTSADHVDFYLKKRKYVTTFKPVEPLDTGGAGDAFNAGCLCYLGRHGTSREAIASLSRDSWERAIMCGVRAAHAVCMLPASYLQRGVAGLE